MNCLIDRLVHCEKGSSKKYDPFLPMVVTWFYGDVSYLNSCLSQFGAPYYSPNYTDTYVAKPYYLYDLRLVLKNIAQRLSWKYQFPCLLYLESYYSFLKNQLEGSLEISLSLLFKCEDIFILLWEYLVPIYYIEEKTSLYSERNSNLSLKTTLKRF